MQSERLAIHCDLAPRPVSFYAELWKKDARTLTNWAAKGWIKGAFKHPSGEWWVDPLTLYGLREGAQEISIDVAETEKRNGSPNTRKVLRTVDSRGKTIVRKPT